MKKGIVISLFIFIITIIFSISGVVYYKAEEKVKDSFYLYGNKIVNIEYGSKYEEAGFYASIDGDENYRKNIKVKNNVKEYQVGEYTVEYTLKYLNYSRTLVRYVNIVDSIEPSLDVHCKADQYVALNAAYKPCSYSAYDNYDKDITDKVIVEGNVNTSKIGDYKVTYKASDSSNNEISRTINVHVRKKFDINYIRISISKQRLYYYQNNEIVLTTPVTTGKNNATRTGNFKVLRKVRNTELKGKDYVSFVKYWLGYDGSSFGIHDASWRRRFGTMDYTYRGSHGCVNVPESAMKKLYGMVEVGTPVYIRK